MSDALTLSLRAALDLRWRRHEVLAHNVANADTPGYKPKDLEFEGVLQQAIDTQPQAPVPGQTVGGGGTFDRLATQDVVERPEIVDTLDENSVDTDREMARIADNSVHYQTATEVLRRRYGLVKSVITDLSRA